MTVGIRITRPNLDECARILKLSPVRDIPGAARTLMECLRMSEEVFLGEIANEPTCIWGLIPPSLLSDSAYLWLLCTGAVASHQFTFIRQSQIVMQRLLERYPIIVGNCVTTDTKAVRWLKWLGAEFSYQGGSVLRFTIRASHG